MYMPNQRTASSIHPILALAAGALFACAGAGLAQQADKPHDVVVVEPKPANEDNAAKQVPEVVPERPLAPLEPEGKRIYHGVCINAENADLFPDRIAKYTEIAGGMRPAVCVQFAHAFDKEKALDWSYHAKVLRTIDAQGAIPFLKATTQSWDNGNLASSQLFFKADDILAGKHDAFFIKAAQVCRDFGKPMFICWNHEMNGDWYSYSEAFANKRPGVSDWTAEKFVKFQRHVWQIFKDQKADNVAFAFAPSIVGRKHGEYDEHNSWKAYYPGDKYVDWIAPSYYNNERPVDLDGIARDTNKPIFVSEWGSSANRPKWYRPQPYPGDGPWMRATLDAWMHRYPNLKGSGYYQWESGYVLQRSPEQVIPYVEALRDPMFIHGPAQDTTSSTAK
jgi:hypothetical protein